MAIDLQPDGTVTYSVIDRWRAPILLTIVGALALVTIAIAGWRGLRALTSLAITVVVVIRLLIPLLLNGYSPVGLAIGLGILISILSLLMTQGFSRPTWAAVAGTAVGLVVTGILAVVVSSAAQFTSAQGSEEIGVIAQIAGGTIDLSGLLLAAVIFGGLGVLNDVAITQAVTIDEFRSIDPTMPRRELYRRAMSVGTAHLAATVNTLVFAYLGSALPIIVLLALQIHRLDLAINDEHIAVEVVRTVVGAIGILSAVPLTTAIAAWWAGPAGRAGTVPRRIMAVPLPVDATPVTVAAAVAAKPPRSRGLRRLLPRRRSKETAAGRGRSRDATIDRCARARTARAADGPGPRSAQAPRATIRRRYRPDRCAPGRADARARGLTQRGAAPSAASSAWRVGIPSRAPATVVDSAAATVARRTASSIGRPSASPTASAPLNVSPAPVLSSARTAWPSTWTVAPSAGTSSAPSRPRVTTTARATPSAIRRCASASIVSFPVPPAQAATSPRFGVRMSAASSSAAAMPSAGAGLRIVVAPARRAAARRAPRPRPRGSPGSRARHRRRVGRGAQRFADVAGSTRAFAPDATLIMFSPAASTRMSATPLGCPGSAPARRHRRLRPSAPHAPRRRTRHRRRLR